MANNKKVLVSLAMLKEHIDGEGQSKNYFDYFIPYFLQVIKQEFNVNQSKTELNFFKIKEGIKKKYGLEIPLDVVHLIIKRIATTNESILIKEKHGEEHKEGEHKEGDKYFIIDIKEIPEDLKKTDEIEKGINLLSETLYNFSQNHTLKFENTNDAFEAILEFLSEFPLETLSHIQKNTALPKIRNRKNIKTKRVILISLFLEHLSLNDKANYNNFSHLVKGYMLTNALLCRGITDEISRINTNFYIDTPLFLSLQGLGKDKKIGKESVEELFSLIRKLGGRLCVFSHTVDEIKNVLQYHCRYPDKAKARGLSKSDFLRVDENLNGILNIAKINIVSTPTVASQSYSTKHQIDEQRLEEKLKTDIRYRDTKAPEHDAKSIASIHLLRRGSNDYHVEKTPSLITTNRKLVSVVNEFEKQENIAGRCSVITSFMATNLLWLKNPMEAPDLPMKTMVAQSYVLRDNPKLWEKLFQQVKELQKEGSVSQADFQYLKANEKIINDMLWEETLGDSSDLDKKIKILQVVNKAKARDEVIAQEMEKTNKAKNETELEKNKSKQFKQTVCKWLAYGFSILCIPIIFVVTKVIYNIISNFSFFDERLQTQLEPFIGGIAILFAASLFTPKSIKRRTKNFYNKKWFDKPVKISKEINNQNKTK